MRDTKLGFIRQQGFAVTTADDDFYAALMFQPRIVLFLGVLGAVLQSPWFFLALSALLWWNAFIPARNPFDAIYNHLIAYPRRLPALGAAPSPRRFAQGMAATDALVIATALFFQAWITTWVFQAVFVAGAAAVVFGRFCSGSYVYHLLRRGVVSQQGSLPTNARQGC
jgi:hypothetical protein